VQRNDAEAQFRLIQRLDDRDMIASTAFFAKRYLAAHPDHGVVWLYYADSLCAMARYPEALSALRRAARLCPVAKRYLVYRRFGHLHEQRGAFRLAEQWFRRAIKARPSVTTDYIFLGALLATSGRLAEAEAVHRKATGCKEGDRDEAFLNLGLVLRALGRFSEARNCFKRALLIDPKYKKARKELSDIEYVLDPTRNA
jgi:tetratricopeptide (TPR) repeat protein